MAAVETEHGSIQTSCVVNCAGGMVLLGLPPQLWSHPFLGWKVRTGRNAEECPGSPRVAAELLSILFPGVWASTVGQMAGVKVPLVAMHHAYVVTERIEGIQVINGDRFSAVGGRVRSRTLP